tara:strand:- start:836 stop:1033 length:198 start_codon:yes stop_codon:yes gene_type:complete
MKNILILLIAFLFVSACGISNPNVSLGKKCVIKGDSVSYSYVWFYDKKNGLPASEGQCWALPKND